MTQSIYPELKILVVDDHMMMRNLISQNLRELGVENIKAVPSGEDAVKEIELCASAGSPYHIVFLDWHMPGLQGIDVLKQCRREPRHNKTAIVMLTAEQEEKNILSAIETGATSYLVKPVARTVLKKNLDTVVVWLEKRGLETEKKSKAAGQAANQDAEENKQAAPATPATSEKKTLSDALRRDLQPVVSKGMRNIFSEIFQLDIVPNEHLTSDDEQKMVCIGRLHEKDITIILRFFFDPILLRPLLRQLYSAKHLENASVYEDAACEIVNILCSQVKAFLNQHDYNLELDFPAVGMQKEKCSDSDSIMNIYFSFDEREGFLVDLSEKHS